MTSKTRWGARLALTGMAAAAIAASTLVTAAPAHADRAQDCAALVTSSKIDFYLYQWYGVFYGYDSRQAQGYLGSSMDAIDFYAINC